MLLILRISKDMSKKVAVTAEDTADDLLERFWKYSSASQEGKQQRDYVFKVAGIREYFLGPHKFFSFEYVQVRPPSLPPPLHLTPLSAATRPTLM